jgi:hypothetical protein
VESEETPSAFPINTVIITVAVVALVLIAAVILIVALVSRNRRSTIHLRKERGDEGR